MVVISSAIWDDSCRADCDKLWKNMYRRDRGKEWRWGTAELVVLDNFHRALQTKMALINFTWFVISYSSIEEVNHNCFILPSD
jgi:hypothetical protein